MEFHHTKPSDIMLNYLSVFEALDPADESFVFMSPKEDGARGLCCSLKNMSHLHEAQEELKSVFENTASDQTVLKPGKAAVVRVKSFFYRGTVICKQSAILSSICEVGLQDLQIPLAVSPKDVRLISGAKGHERMKSSSRAFCPVDLQAELRSTMKQRGMGWVPPYGIGKRVQNVIAHQGAADLCQICSGVDLCLSNVSCMFQVLLSPLGSDMCMLRISVRPATK